MKNAVLYILMVCLLVLSSCDSNGVSVIAGGLDPNSNYSIVVADVVDVAIQDQHTEIIDLLMHQHLEDVILTSDYNIGDYSINVTSSITITTGVGKIVCLKEGVAFYQAHILSVVSLGGNAYTIEFDTPLDHAFTTAAYGSYSESNWAVDASAAPQTFKVSSANLNDGTSWDIVRMILVCGGEGIGPTNAAPDDSDFMVTDALTKGIVVRSVNGITKNIFNAKTNGQLRGRTFDVVYTAKSKNGLYSTGTRRTFNGLDKNGVTIRLDASTEDSIELIVQDDLTEMIRCQMIVQGHVVDY